MTELLRGVNLFGMMNCGKTTIGRMIAEQCGVPFVDTDELITAVYGNTPGVIIQSEGPDAFMTIQREIIMDTAREAAEVWATGGAVARDQELVGFLRGLGLNTFLQIDPVVLEERYALSGKVLVNPKGLPFGELYEERLPLYLGAADLVVDIANPNAPKYANASFVLNAIVAHQQAN